MAAWKISQKDKGKASSRQDNSSHFIDGMWLICKAELLLPPQDVQRPPFLHKLQLLAPYQSHRVPSERLCLPVAWAAPLCFEGFTPIQKSWSMAFQRNNLWSMQSVGGFASLGGRKVIIFCLEAIVTFRLLLTAQRETKEWMVTEKVLLLRFSSFQKTCFSGAVGSLCCCCQQHSCHAVDEDLCCQTLPGFFLVVVET